MPGPDSPIFFASPAEWRAWLKANHEAEPEVTVGFWRKSTGRPSMTWPQAVDEALCFGWIDGVRRKLDDERFTNRFTPRRRRSNWSAVNVARVEALTREGRMMPAGLAAFEKRGDHNAVGYSLGNRPDDFPPGFRSLLDADATAVAAWEGIPPGARRAIVSWVTSARQDATRLRRFRSLLAGLIAGELPPRVPVAVRLKPMPPDTKNRE